MPLILEFPFGSFMRPSGCWSLSQQNKWSSPACPLEEQNGEKRRSLSPLTGEGYRSELPGLEHPFCSSVGSPLLLFYGARPQLWV